MKLRVKAALGSMSEGQRSQTFKFRLGDTLSGAETDTVKLLEEDSWKLDSRKGRASQEIVLLLKSLTYQKHAV